MTEENMISTYFHSMFKILGEIFGMDWFWVVSLYYERNKRNTPDAAAPRGKYR